MPTKTIEPADNVVATKRILILMSATGGGHKASAEALKAGFEQRYPGQFEIDIVDLLIDHMPIVLRELPKVYPILANDAQWAWKLLWATGDHPRPVRRFMQLVARLAEKNIIHLFRQYNPDIFISVHPLVHELSFRALRKMRWRRPFVTVVTDLASTHALWFAPKVTTCFVASDVAFRHALQCGLHADQIKLYGLPVRPAFSMPISKKAELRTKLNMHPTLPAVLIVGGGDGIGPVAEIAEQLSERLAGNGRPIGQVVVVCGRNQSLLEEVRSIQWSVPVKVNGFVTNMAEWMAACDCIVTKAGPGTIAEALICGLPILLSGFIPGQEAENVPYVVENGAGAFSTRPAEIARTVERWFTSDSDRLEQMSQNAKRLARPNATLHIVESIAELVGVKSELRVAILSDIHGNLTALDAVIADVERRGGVDEYWVLGDLVAIGPNPTGVLERLINLPKVRFARGNTDRYVVTGERPAPTLDDVKKNPEMLSTFSEITASFAWTQGIVTAAGWLEWLERLPLEIRGKLPDGTYFLGVHASPGSDDGDGLRPDLNEEQIHQLFGQDDADVICVGHNHWPMEKKIAGKHLVNIGSVSNSFLPNGHASYVLLRADQEDYALTHCQVEYDRAAVVEELERMRFPGKKYVTGLLSGEKKAPWQKEEIAVH